ncbi:MAG TPA: FtsX-like permease family protein [Candidatus Binataceae bacterium]|nr:FtsX-like permease family protein [Candidatus Binataceae bacterium]
MKLLPLVLRNLLRNRRRTLLTILSIAVSVFMFGALMSLPTLIDEVLQDRVNSVRIITSARTGMSYPLPSSYAARIRRLPHVEAVTGESVFPATYRDPKDLVPAAAMDPTQIEAIFSDFDIKPGEAEELRRTRSGVLVGTELMKLFHWHVGDNLILHGISYPIDLQLKIVGTLGGKVPPSAVLMRQDFLDEALGRPGTVTLIFTKVDRSDSIPAVASAIDALFANSSAETRSESEVGFARMAIKNYRILFDGMKFVAAIVVFTIALVAGNTASMAVRERRHELAIMRSMGFTRGAVISSLTVEGSLIGLVSGLVGCALAYGILRLTPHLARSLGPLAFRIGFLPKVAFEGLVIAIAIGTVSTLIPALVEGHREISAELRAIV